MSFTPLDGIPMASRCGALDPGVLLYLLREEGMSLEQLDDLLHHRAGLLGVSGISGDVRTLLASDHPHAADALDLFAYRTSQAIAGHAVALDGIDALVFTAGIGEHAAPVRAAICRHLAWLGLTLDEAANVAMARASATAQPVSAWVIPTNEERVIAQPCLDADCRRRLAHGTRADGSGHVCCADQNWPALPPRRHRAPHEQEGNSMDASAPQSGPLSADELNKLDAYWRACNYLAAGMIYLRDNPLLSEPLQPEHIKKRLFGHWGASPGLSFAYIHLNRLINKYDLDAIFLAGPGHGAPGVLAPVYLEGTYSEIYPNKGEDEEGMLQFFKEFSFPGGIGSHCTPETPGSIHEGGELGYSVSHAFGAAFDNPDLLVTVVVGDGESETGPLATSWHSNKFLNPIRDGAVLPILHLNGYKINNPTAAVAHLPRGTGAACSRAMAGRRISSKARIPGPCTEMAGVLEQCVLEIRRIQDEARAQRRSRTAALADDRVALAQGLDRPERSGRPQGGRLLAFAPGAARRRAKQSGPPEATGRLAAQL